MLREDILNKYKINTFDLYKNEKEFIKELNSITKRLNEILKYKNKVMSNSKTLYEVLKLDQEISIILENLYIYAHLNNDFDLSNTKFNEHYNKVLNIYNKYQTNISFLIPEILKSDYKLVLKYIEEFKDLEEFKLNLKEVFRFKKHTLNDNEEELLSKISLSFRLPNEAFSILSDVNMKLGYIRDELYKKVELTNSNYSRYLESRNKRVRKEAFYTMYKAYKNFNDTYTTFIKTEVKNNNNISNIRGYKSSLEKSLFNNNIDIKVYNKLIDNVNKNIKVLHKQWPLRKKILNLKELNLYDTYTPLIKEGNKEYSFDVGKELVLNSLKVLGKNYTNALNKAFDNNWIDIYPNKYKRSGAYATCSYKAHPYVLLNYENKLNDVFTLTHELGHAMHYYYAMNNQNYNNYNYSIFVAEVASQVNEILLSKYMLDNTYNKKDKMLLIDASINRFKGAVVRQTMFSEFEKLIHDYDFENIILTKDVLNEEYLKLNNKYFGNDVIVNEEIKYEWSRIPHFYYNFYVYQYATGYIASLYIADKIYKKEKGALENYMKFLKLGSTLDPVKSLKVAGVDMLSDEVYKFAFDEFEYNLKELNKLYSGDTNE